MRPKAFGRNFTAKNFSDTVDFLNTLFTNGLTLENNFGAQILEVTLPASGVEVAIAHRLKVVPKYRIILRQDDQGTIMDGFSQWTDKTIYLRAANLSIDVNITLMLIKA
jgi:hypothetical protein